VTDLQVPPAANPTVAAVRHSPVVGVGQRDTLWDAWQLMFVSGLRHLAVVDDGGSCVGILTDRAILTEIPLTEERLSGRLVADIMAVPGTVTDDTTTHEAASLMARHSVDAMPIVSREGRLVGLLTAADLVDWVART